ncbi:MAG: NFACT family protein [Candidatus Marsarchaeota archaeon]|nr:NFACT family protein [Candidatus Marsarchaeota archaeon]
MQDKIRALSSAELGAVAKELQILASSYFKSFYELRPGSFLITFSKERKETAVYVNLANTVNITEFKERETTPTEFALAVRRMLDGSRLESIEQHGADRILVMRFSGRERREVIVEMFGKGNLILTNAAGIIEKAYTSRDFKDRSTKKGMLYAFPTQRGKAAPEDESERIAEVKGGRFASLSKLLDSLYIKERSTEANPEKAREAEELRKSVEKLRKQADEMRERGEDYKKIANTIFARMHEFNELLEKTRKSGARNVDELNGLTGIRVKRLDAKKKTVTVEMD